MNWGLTKQGSYDILNYYMSKKLNLTGLKRGRLTVVEQARIISPRTFWICQCECDGMYVIVMGKNITQGKVLSCGCLRRELSRQRAAKNSILNTLPIGESSFNQLYAVYAFHAGKRDLPFDLNKEDFKKLTDSDCKYCGVKPYQEYRPNHKSGSYIYNGIDRLNNEDGYTKSNSVSCCGVCNDMKRTRSVSEFLTACKAIVEHQKGPVLETSPSNV